MLDLASKPMNLGQLLIKDFTLTAWGHRRRDNLALTDQEGNNK